MKKEEDKNDIKDAITGPSALTYLYVIINIICAAYLDAIFICVVMSYNCLLV